MEVIHGQETGTCTTAAESEARQSLETAPELRPGDWYPCFTPDITTGQALLVAAERLGVAAEDIEMMRMGGAVECRKRLEES